MKVLFIIAGGFLIAMIGQACDDDDDSSADAEPVDDDDAVVDDDDQSVTPTADDDDDNDDNDNDDDNDDTAPSNPYDGMTPGGRTLDETLGISSHMSRGVEYSWKREFEIARLVEAGMTMMRTDFHWYTIEPEDDVWNFDGLDTMVDLCRAADLEITAIFLGAPDWAIPGGSPDEIDPEKYADFTGQTAAHFADRINTYEFWNEENTTRFWSPEPNPAHYGELLKATYQAVHANDPDATVIFGGLSSFEKHFFDPHGIWNFVYRVYEEHPDICDYFDAISIHPYTFLQQPSPEFDLDLVIYHYPSTVGFVDLLRETLDLIGCPDKRIQFTEMGWPSLIINDERQAAYLPRSLLPAMSRGVEFYDWYTFWDGSGDATLPTEDYFGLFTYPIDEQTEPKPSYEALMGAHLILGDSRYAGDLREALEWDGEVYAMVFATDDDVWTVALWRGGPWLDQTETVKVPLPTNTDGLWVLLDQNGEETASGESLDGTVEVTVSGRVAYLQFQVTR